jgi:hypothetical protein
MAQKKGFTAEERTAMRERTEELKAGARRGKADGESDVLAKIAEMPQPDRGMADGLRAEELDHRRREKDPRAREESGELTADLVSGRSWIRTTDLRLIRAAL